MAQRSTPVPWSFKIASEGMSTSRCFGRKFLSERPSNGPYRANQASFQRAPSWGKSDAGKRERSIIVGHAAYFGRWGLACAEGYALVRHEAYSYGGRVRGNRGAGLIGYAGNG